MSTTHPERIVAVLANVRDAMSWLMMKRTPVLCMECAQDVPANQQLVQIQEQDLPLPEPENVGGREVLFLRCARCRSVFDPLRRTWTKISTPEQEPKYGTVVSPAARAVERELRQKMRG